MTLAIKCVHNLPLHLSNVFTLPDITLNRNTALMSWSRGSLTLGTIFLMASSTRPVANVAACMCKGKGTSLWTPLWFSHPTGLEPLRTPETSFFQSHTHYWEEDNITLPFFVCVMSGSVETQLRYGGKLCMRLIARYSRLYASLIIKRLTLL